MPVLMLILCAACWALSFPLIKGVLIAQGKMAPDAGVWFLTAEAMLARFGLGAVILAVARPGKLLRTTKLEWKLGIGLGLAGGIGMFFQMAGLKYTLASTSAFLTQFYALVIPVVLAIYYRRWPHWLVWVSCLLVVAGMGVLCDVDWRNFQLGKGEWLTLLAAVIFTAQILWLDRQEFRECDKINATVVMFVTIVAMLAPVALTTAVRVSDLWTLNASLPVGGMQLLLALVPAVGGFVLMNSYQPKVSATQAGLIYCAEPVFASLYALFLPAWLGRFGGFEYANEQVTALLLVGGLLITAANVLIQLTPNKE
jgi:drug/metabolite transporter (DMT)-like permease